MTPGSGHGPAGKARWSLDRGTVPAVFEDGPVGIWLVDGNLRTLEMNGAMSRMLGYTAEELGQRTFADVTHPATSQATWP